MRPSQLPGWAADDLAGLPGAIERQCAMSRPPVPWPVLCAEFRQPQPDLREWIERRFFAWPLTGADGQTQGLLTGYYEPLIRGSRRRESTTQSPLYRRPIDLLRVDVNERGAPFSPVMTPLRGRVVADRVVPYYTRVEIETGSMLAGQELLWLDDPVDSFFLQIQGSGRVMLRDGTITRVGYADHNGQTYRSIGKVLAERGLMTGDGVNAETIKAWLRANRQTGVGIMQSNPRYIFFRELPALPGDVGPPGSLGVNLTPERSIATDPQRVPPGALMFMATTYPITNQPMNRLMMNQDTGAAILGPVRADLFWGFGENAERQASMTKQRLRLWVLWPQELGAPPKVR